MNRWELYGMLKRGIRLYDFDEKELEEKIYKMDIYWVKGSCYGILVDD